MLLPESTIPYQPKLEHSESCLHSKSRRITMYPDTSRIQQPKVNVHGLGRPSQQLKELSVLLVLILYKSYKSIENSTAHKYIP